MFSTDRFLKDLRPVFSDFSDLFLDFKRPVTDEPQIPGGSEGSLSFALGALEKGSCARRRCWPVGRYIFLMRGRQRLSPRGPIHLPAEKFEHINEVDKTERIVAVERGSASICSGLELIRFGEMNDDWEIFDEWESLNWAKAKMREGNRVRHRYWPSSWYAFRFPNHLPAWALSDKVVCQPLKDKIRLLPSTEVFVVATDKSVQELTGYPSDSKGWELAHQK